jgi:putative phosphoesterase
VSNVRAKIGVISDTHGDLDGWQRCMDTIFRDAELIIHGGDILYHGPKNPMVRGYGPPALAEAINGAGVPVVIARGNCDSPVDQLVIETPIQAPYAFVQLDGLRIAAHHGDGLSDEEKARWAASWKLDIFITAHTHIRELTLQGDTVFLNPGSPAIPKSDGSFEAVPTAATIEADGVRIWDITAGTVVCGPRELPPR